MRVTVLAVSLAMAAISCALAQSADERMTFEVASVKVSEPPTMGRFSMGTRGGPGTPDPGHITINNLSMKNLLANAYNLRSYQISGPEWLDSARFDIVAKVPMGATKEQVRYMMQNLLKERFKLSLHHETKDMPMYALVVGKNGPKFKEAVEEAAPAPGTAATNPAGGPADDGPKLQVPIKLQMGPDGMPQMPAGMGPRTGCMQMMMMNSGGPRSHMVCKAQTMEALANQLSNQLDKPVTDMTKLSAKYDFTLDYAPDPNSGRMGGMVGMGGASVMIRNDGPGPGGDGPGHGGGDGDKPEQVAAAPLPAAVQEQLGLKLEQKKGPVDIIVIDKAEKVPTEN